MNKKNKATKEEPTQTVDNNDIKLELENYLKNNESKKIIEEQENQLKLKIKDEFTNKLDILKNLKEHSKLEEINEFLFQAVYLNNISLKKILLRKLVYFN
jgi:hypothetical protein